MHRLFLIIFCLTLLVPLNSFAGKAPTGVMKPVIDAMGGEAISDSNKTSFMMEIALLHSILRNTPEMAIHQMNGQTKNQVYFKKTGEEVVFDENGDRVDECENMGSYNFAHSVNEPFKHFAFDMFPWFLWGNCKEDKTIMEQRISAYVQDFELGLTRVSNNGNFGIAKDFKIDHQEQAHTITFLLEVFNRSDLPLKDFVKSNGLKKPELQKQFIASFKKSLLGIMNEYAYLYK